MSSFPLDWYWLADDGRVYASARNVVVDKTDKDFVAAQSSGGVTRWPVDETGAQTTASMQDVVKVYGLAVPGPASLAAYAASALEAKFAAGETFNVAAQDQPAVNVLVDGTNDTRADLGLLALFGQQNPTGTKTWLDNAGVTTQLTGAQLVTLTTLVGTWVSDCYPVLASVLAGVAAGSITTTAAIDQAFAAVKA